MNALTVFGIAINGKVHEVNDKARNLKEVALKCIVHSVFRGPGNCGKS